MSKKPYKVGYKCPPKSGQWKKGQSGNPSGKKKAPRPHLNFAKYVSEELLREVENTETGERMPAIKALARKGVYLGIRGNAKEHTMVVELYGKVGAMDITPRPLEELDGDGDEIFSEEDRRLLDFFQREIMGPGQA